jgi:NitT/TauT family transport system ATP-binding protein
LKEGDVQIAREGVQFADADIQRRKVLFREAVLKHVTILKQIDSILHRKSDHSIADEFFHDILDEHFSEDEVQRQFETALNWGRYAEIFDYDGKTGKLVLAEHPHAEPPVAAPEAEHNSSAAPKS